MVPEDFSPSEDSCVENLGGITSSCPIFQKTVGARVKRAQAKKGGKGRLDLSSLTCCVSLGNVPSEPLVFVSVNGMGICHSGGIK